MAAKAKKKGLIYRLGYVYGWCSRRYLRFEEPVIRWGVKKGLPAALAGLMRWLIRLSLVGAFLLLAFWGVIVVFGIYVLKEILSSESDFGAEENKFDDTDFCPDRFSPDYIHDPRFDHKP
ncbi:Protein of unknown function [Pseudomonas asplenii]|uniref:DUF3742 family protein n=1 Tax=Pseudomonas asplenii TaxID=53407 RepID=A0A1H1XGA5_9PSED|nr:DUF3742 family protein [Pseudomonas asplenii]SDT07799.1 Protein of unknown function [Pseudomonas asplenii]